MYRVSRPLTAFLAVVSAAFVVLAACTTTGSLIPSPPAPETPSQARAIPASPGTLAVASPSAAPSAEGAVTVFAASSLTDAFTELGAQFRAANPTASTIFNFSASTQLVTQIDQGAKADVFASADQAQMDRARTAGLLDGSDRVFAMNRLVVITPASNPGSVRTLADLARPGVKLVTSQPDVPVGVYTRAIFDRMSQDAQFGTDFKDRVNANVVSREANVRQIVSKVQLGEADAGVVYQTDVTPQVAGQLAIVDVPDAFNTLARYPIARVKAGPNPGAADAFVAFVLSPAGQAILARWGFLQVQPG